MSKLTGLTYLSLNSSGGINDGSRNSLAGLEALEQLQELHVSDMREAHSAVERVCKLTGLTTLKMSGEPGKISLLDGHLPSHLTNLSNLQSLSLTGIRGHPLGDNRLTQAAEDVFREMLESFPHLKEVELQDIFFKTGGTALQAFQRHKTLQTLRILRCFYVTDLTGLDGLPSLSTLEIDAFENLDSHLTCLPALKRLELGGSVDSGGSLSFGVFWQSVYAA